MTTGPRRRAGRRGLREPRPGLRLLPRHVRLRLLRRQGRAGRRHRQLCDSGTSSSGRTAACISRPAPATRWTRPPTSSRTASPRTRPGCGYECQSGALNESISDIMAWNLDPEDPTYGEDRNGDGADDPDGGTIRDYRLPTRFDQPMNVDDYQPPQRQGRRLGRRAHQQRHPEPRLLPARQPRRARRRPSRSSGARSPSTSSPTRTSRTSAPR